MYDECQVLSASVLVVPQESVHSDNSNVIPRITCEFYVRYPILLSWWGLYQSRPKPLATMFCIHLFLDIYRSPPEGHNYPSQLIFWTLIFLRRNWITWHHFYHLASLIRVQYYWLKVRFEKWLISFRCTSGSCMFVVTLTVTLQGLIF